MENNPKIVKRIEEIIEELACYNNPGPTAVRAANIIVGEFILVPKIDLPSVDVRNGKAHLESVSEWVCKGDTDRMRDMAYQYLAMAEYVDMNQKNKEAEELAARRLEVWKELNPLPFDADYYAERWTWDSLKSSERRSIDMILDLRSKIDS